MKKRLSLSISSGRGEKKRHGKKAGKTCWRSREKDGTSLPISSYYDAAASFSPSISLLSLFPGYVQRSRFLTPSLLCSIHATDKWDLRLFPEFLFLCREKEMGGKKSGNPRPNGSREKGTIYRRIFALTANRNVRKDWWPEAVFWFANANYVERDPPAHLRKDWQWIRK